ncbi:polysaccharide biosynthesis protein, partial [Leptospira sp. SA-E8]|uniref:polysaccharide biosynthesis protein n=1 Tax=Leptospira sp. SA-E8 TaxID=3422259 RepID=UPI003EB85270
AATANNTAINVTRYGNVLFSRGSVIPYFIQCAKRGDPLRVTEPGMTRFLLPLADATTLVERALFSQESGNLYVMKSSAATVQTIANAIRNNVNPEAGVDVVGFRPGEKMHETLLTEEEIACSVEEGDCFKSNPRLRNPQRGKAYTSDKTERLDEVGLWKLLTQQSELKELL